MSARAVEGTEPEISRRSILKGTAALGAGLVLESALRDSTDPVARARRSRDRTTRPNVIVIMADDMRHDEARYMPHLQQFIASRGTTFTAARHNVSECSAARAGFLTGQYSKRHHVRSQQDAFLRNNDVNKTLAVWLQSSGYHTGIIGKYFTTIEGRSTPPGWDFRRQLAARSQEQHGYEVWDGQTIRRPALDQTRYLQNEVLSFLDGAPEPFFLWFTPTADHSPYQPPPTHEHEFARLQWPDPREQDVTDKPPWIQELPPLSDRIIAVMRRAQRLRLRELLGLDDTIATIDESLRSRGRIDNTVVVFTSDNGVLMGEHRIPPGSKNVPYEPAVLVPCLVRGEGFPHTTVRQPVQMSVDLTATCVELAGAQPDLPLDGVSLTEIAAHPRRFDSRRLLYDRAGLDGFIYTPPSLWPPAADGIFTRARKLVRYQRTPPIYELYDLDADPRELRNVADHRDYADDRAELETELDQLLAG